MIDLQFTNGKLEVEKTALSICTPNCGAVSFFLGVIREDEKDGKKVTKLIYEAYESMALKIMKNICNEIQEKWPQIVNIAIHHRLGEVPVNETSLIVAVSAPHRQELSDAVTFAVNKVKETVPIFKKEIYDGAPAEWKENSECTWGSNQIRKDTQN